MKDESQPYGVKRGTCATCEQPMWRSSSSLPQGVARCRPCRRLTSARDYDYRKPCIDCGQPSYGQRCRACADRTQRFRPDDDPRVRRADREKAAPGLTRRQRDALMRKWRTSQARCAYCQSPATTMDHIVPLVRGGTNHEGNLAPCCKRCNSSKAGWLISEWRHNRKPDVVVDGITWLVKPRAPRAPRISLCKVFFIDCASCGQPTTARNSNTQTCSKACSYEHNKADQVRKYRMRVGIPLDAPPGTKARLHSATCVECAATVATPSPQRLYCSRRCQKRAYKRRRGTGRARVHQRAA